MPEVITGKSIRESSPDALEVADAETDSENREGEKSKCKRVLRRAKDTDFKYVCEWADCCHESSSLNEFNHHVGLHRKAYTQHLDQEGEFIFYCHWRDCLAQIEGRVENFSRHIHYHCFHQYLKCLGRKVQGTQEDATPCALDQASRNLIPELPERLQCRWGDCDMVYDNPYIFYSHVAHHCEDNPKDRDISVPIKCLWEGCSTSVKSWYRMRDHMRSHTQAKVVACPTCGSLFASNTCFIDHLLRQVQGGTNFVCSSCGAKFGSERLLRDHMRRHVNHYKCPLCDMTCPSPSAVRDHVRYRHSEVRSFHCQQCKYSAKTAIDLRKHMLSGKHNKKKMSVYEAKMAALKERADALGQAGVAVALDGEEEVETGHLKTRGQNKTKAGKLRKEKTGCNGEGAQEDQLQQGGSVAEESERSTSYDVSTEEMQENEDRGNTRDKTPLYECHLCKVRCTRGTYLTSHLKEVHKYKWPSGHKKFRYKLHPDGLKRLHVLRYESIEVSEQVLGKTLPPSQSTPRPTSHGVMPPQKVCYVNGEMERNGHVGAVGEGAAGAEGQLEREVNTSDGQRRSGVEEAQHSASRTDGSNIQASAKGSGGLVGHEATVSTPVVSRRSGAVEDLLAAAAVVDAADRPATRRSGRKRKKRKYLSDDFVCPEDGQRPPEQVLEPELKSVRRDLSRDCQEKSGIPHDMTSPSAMVDNSQTVGLMPPSSTSPPKISDSSRSLCMPSVEDLVSAIQSVMASESEVESIANKASNNLISPTKDARMTTAHGRVRCRNSSESDTCGQQYVDDISGNQAECRTNEGHQPAEVREKSCNGSPLPPPSIPALPSVETAITASEHGLEDGDTTPHYGTDTDFSEYMADSPGSVTSVYTINPVYAKKFPTRGMQQTGPPSSWSQNDIESPKAWPDPAMEYHDAEQRQPETACHPELSEKCATATTEGLVEGVEDVKDEPSPGTFAEVFVGSGISQIFSVDSAFHLSQHTLQQPDPLSQHTFQQPDPHHKISQQYQQLNPHHVTLQYDQHPADHISKNDLQQQQQQQPQQHYHHLSHDPQQDLHHQIPQYSQQSHPYYQSMHNQQQTSHCQPPQYDQQQHDHEQKSSSRRSRVDPLEAKTLADLLPFSPAVFEGQGNEHQVEIFSVSERSQSNFATPTQSGQFPADHNKSYTLTPSDPSAQGSSTVSFLHKVSPITLTTSSPAHTPQARHSLESDRSNACQKHQADSATDLMELKPLMVAEGSTQPPPPSSTSAALGSQHGELCAVFPSPEKNVFSIGWSLETGISPVKQVVKQETDGHNEDKPVVQFSGNASNNNSNSAAGESVQPVISMSDASGTCLAQTETLAAVSSIISSSGLDGESSNGPVSTVVLEPSTSEVALSCAAGGSNSVNGADSNVGSRELYHIVQDDKGGYKIVTLTKDDLMSIVCEQSQHYEGDPYQEGLEPNTSGQSQQVGVTSGQELIEPSVSGQGPTLISLRTGTDTVHSGQDTLSLEGSTVAGREEQSPAEDTSGFAAVGVMEYPNDTVKTETEYVDVKPFPYDVKSEGEDQAEDADCAGFGTVNDDVTNSGEEPPLFRIPNVSDSGSEAPSLDEGQGNKDRKKRKSRSVTKESHDKGARKNIRYQQETSEFVREAVDITEIYTVCKSGGDDSNGDENEALVHAESNSATCQFNLDDSNSVYTGRKSTAATESLAQQASENLSSQNEGNDADTVEGDTGALYNLQMLGEVALSSSAKDSGASAPPQPGETENSLSVTSERRKRLKKRGKVKY